MLYFLWIPLAIFFNVFQAWLSTKVAGDKMFFYFLWLWGALPMWAFVSKYSKNLFFDALLYDSILVVSFSMSLLVFTGTILKPINIVGLFLLLLALILIKI